MKGKHWSGHITAAMVLAFGMGYPVYAEEKVQSFGKQELAEFLTGKTYPIGQGKGAFYFDKGGKLFAVWKGEKEEATWWTTEDSQFCYDLKLFGGEECIGLFRAGKDGLIHKFGNKERAMKVSDLKQGKQF